MLIVAFGLSFAALILQSVLCPPFALLAFAPWISLVSLRLSLPKALWLGAMAGVVVDLISDDPIGIHALNYCLTAASLFRFRNHFLHDNPLHLSLFSIFVSLTSTALQMFLLFLFDRRVPFTGKWFLTDLIAMPMIDGLYALVWVAAPLVVYHKLRRYGSLYWCDIKRNLFRTSP